MVTKLVSCASSNRAASIEGAKIGNMLEGTVLRKLNQFLLNKLLKTP
jgi:hypothetical protein